MAAARQGSQAEVPLVACTPQEAAAPPVREAAPAPEGRQSGPEQSSGWPGPANTDSVAKMDWSLRARLTW